MDLRVTTSLVFWSLLVLVPALTEGNQVSLVATNEDGKQTDHLSPGTTVNLNCSYDFDPQFLTFKNGTDKNIFAWNSETGQKLIGPGFEKLVISDSSGKGWLSIDFSVPYGYKDEIIKCAVLDQGSNSHEDKKTFPIGVFHKPICEGAKTIAEHIGDFQLTCEVFDILPEAKFTWSPECLNYTLVAEEHPTTKFFNQTSTANFCTMDPTTPDMVFTCSADNGIDKGSCTIEVKREIPTTQPPTTTLVTTPEETTTLAEGTSTNKQTTTSADTTVSDAEIPTTQPPTTTQETTTEETTTQETTTEAETTTTNTQTTLSELLTSTIPETTSTTGRDKTGSTSGTTEPDVSTESTTESTINSTEESSNTTDVSTESTTESTTEPSNTTDVSTESTTESTTEPSNTTGTTTTTEKSGGTDPPPGDDLGLIIGLSVGGVLLVGAVIGVVFYLKNKRNQPGRKALSDSESTLDPPPDYEGTNDSTNHYTGNNQNMPNGRDKTEQYDSKPEPTRRESETSKSEWDPKTHTTIL